MAHAEIDICNSGNTDLHFARLATGPYNLLKGSTYGKMDAFSRIAPGTCYDVHWDSLETVAFAFFQQDSNGTWGNTVYNLGRSSEKTLGNYYWAPEYICLIPGQETRVVEDRPTILKRYTPPCRAPAIEARVSFAAKTQHTDRPLKFTLSPDKNILLEPWGAERAQPAQPRNTNPPRVAPKEVRELRSLDGMYYVNRTDILKLVHTHSTGYGIPIYSGKLVSTTADYKGRIKMGDPVLFAQYSSDAQQLSVSFKAYGAWGCDSESDWVNIPKMEWRSSGVWTNGQSYKRGLPADPEACMAWVVDSDCNQVRCSQRVGRVGESVMAVTRDLESARRVRASDLLN